MSYNRKQYHRRSIRLPGYDYTQPGAYYITICTYQKQCWFGDVVNGIMHCNQLGHIAHSFWLALPCRFPHIQLEAFVIMPNHLHGILMILDGQSNTMITDYHPRKMEKFGKPVTGSIPTVIRSFKSAVTKRINLLRRSSSPPIWQRNYYESIIRIESGLDKVRDYIVNNPQHWDSDQENPQSHPSYQVDSLDLYF